jgi:hypothetical protein
MTNSACPWCFAARHLAQARVVPLSGEVTPLKIPRARPSGEFVCVHGLRCVSCQGDKHSRRGAPCHERRQAHCIRHDHRDGVLGAPDSIKFDTRALLKPSHRQFFRIPTGSVDGQYNTLHIKFLGYFIPLAASARRVEFRTNPNTIEDGPVLLSRLHIRGITRLS